MTEIINILVDHSLNFQKEGVTQPPWIHFQFEGNWFISNIIIYNRQNFPNRQIPAINRLFPFEIRIINEAGIEQRCQDKQFQVGDPEIPENSTFPITINCGNLIGSSLKLIGFHEEKILNICEIKIIGW